MHATGPARVGRRTKWLAARLRRGDVAIIDHRDLDEVAARSLLDRGVRAVVNADTFLSGRYPAGGARLLAAAGVALVEEVGRSILDLPDGVPVEIEDDLVRAAGREWRGRAVAAPELEERWRRAHSHLRAELAAFLANTIDHARKEQDLVLQPLELPRLATRLEGRAAVVVVRGHAYTEDLAAVRPFLLDTRPVLIGVDGGADAILQAGFRPDMVVGDMDSVSDRALRLARDVIVHAYPDGRAPGWTRVKALGLPARRVPAAGTSEDLALLLAYQGGARPIVVVGAHTNIVDFLEKGRPGMASTFLTRLLIGHVLIDAKGVSRLYRGGRRPVYAGYLLAAAALPLGAIFAALPVTRIIARLWWLELRMALGW
ncbi:MAG: hypothetical protein IMW98_02450 [Firmicutes bacterium]|nr:hypothetical protein [Bacillota bacterium]